MKKKELDKDQLFLQLFQRYPTLEVCKKDILCAYNALESCYKNGRKLLVAGNGGSAADSDHISSELLKSFLFIRNIEKDFKNNMEQLYKEEGLALCDKLEGALPTIPLTALPAFTTAFANDADSSVSFAQAVYGLGEVGDVFFGISTTGNSKNIVNAIMAAKAKGLTTIALLGGSGGRCADLADFVICVPEKETFKVQEYHLPIYHALCAMLEAELFTERQI